MSRVSCANIKTVVAIWRFLEADRRPFNVNLLTVQLIMY